jgi:UDP-N-acetylmuramoyl-L-alanyl-D-glutamate--2,6-diaminopimelate ligase
VDATFPQVRLADLVAVVGGELRGDPSAVVRDAAYDSRSVEPGSLFFCIPGATADGHVYASDAVAAGAAALVVERFVDVDVPQLRVRSVREAMGPIAAELFGHPARSLTVVGITGTNGKTTITYLLEGVFRAAGLVPGVLGTTGLRIDGEPGPLARTTPEAPDMQRVLARMVAAGVRAVALEASSHALAQHRLDGLIVDAAVFTNLSQDHLDFHPSMDAYFDAKALLFTPEHAAKGVVNADDAWGRRLAADATIPVRTYGLDGPADVRGREVVVDANGVRFAVDGVEVRSALHGRFNASNCLAAFAAGLAIDLSPAAIADGIASVARVPGRMEPVDAGQPFAVVVDYAHTPDSILSVLRGARALADDGQVMVVFGCGGDRDRAKRPLMGRAATEGADLVIVTSDNPRHEDPDAIIGEIIGGIADRSRVVVEPDRRRAISLAIHRAGPHDVVVIAGKGHETTQTIGDDVVPFDDRVVAREALAETMA